MESGIAAGPGNHCLQSRLCGSGHGRRSRRFMKLRKARSVEHVSEDSFRADDTEEDQRQDNRHSEDRRMDAERNQQ